MAPNLTGPAALNLTDAVEGTLADFLAREIAALDEMDPALGGFARTARDCVLAGGKRLRPTFAYWGWRGAAGPEQRVEPVLPAFAALELLHTFALVHDDVMDGSDTRRGHPTAHRVLEAQHAAAGRRGDPARFGEASAVLIGDLCLVWADRLLGAADVSDAVLLGARRCYDQMRIETIAGQYLDILGEAEPGSWSVARALRVARHKTAAYTVLRPLHFGLTLAAPATAKRSHALLDAYSGYGLGVGEAFQLRDDLLGVYGEPAVTGKPAGDDLLAGKPTALLMLAREMATSAQLAELGCEPRTEADVQHLAQVVADTGAPERVEKMIEERVAAAVHALRRAPIDDVTRNMLTGLAVTATQRQA
ncbi:polyprenyl synthetase family protein [Catenuloplanes sp. NPDC051500]|uniref:polyprenyl synthetase family protein n=1 Tax=Catenuloplanes sp. NPDC051500 TaxID=3363959 RepID=UPI00379BE254